MAAPLEHVRVDRWLLAARVFKTRTLAQEACAGGKVEVNGARVTAHKLLRVGDHVSVRGSRGRRELDVAALAERRLGPPEARLLYEDVTPAPPPEIAAPPLAAQREAGAGRPTKRDRRRIDRFRGA